MTRIRPGEEVYEMRHIRRTSALVTILALSMAVPAPAEPTDGVPIHGTIVGVDAEPDMTATDRPAGTEWSWRYVSEGGGVVSHLGRVDGTITHCTVLNADGSGEFGARTTTFTAANGDVLLMEHSGTFQMIDLGADVDGVWTVTGGTGRFDGASRNGTFTAFSDFIAGTTSAEYHGMIQNDASSRAG